MGEATVATGQLWHFLHHLFSTAGVRAQSDGELLDRFARQRDEEAFAGLVQRHGPMVLSVCRRLLHQPQDAEDAFQATFLVLAKKAGAIRKQESVGSWLYGAAYRMALKVRESAGRRLSHERPSDESPDLAEVPAVSPPDISDLERRELRTVLDEELQGLPEKYRAPLVLCYLEGKTNEQAALELSWTKGTVSGRLARARDLLRERLAKRGLALTTAALTAVFSEQLSAAPPGQLVSSTVQAAALFAAGKTVPAHIAILAEGAIRAMTMSKLKVASMLIFAIAVAAFGAGLVQNRLKGAAIAVAVPTNGAKPGSTAEAKPETGKTDPPGVPLQLRLVAKKSTYALDLGGKTPAEFRKLIQEKQYPPAPLVDLALEVRNTSNQEIEFTAAGDYASFKEDDLAGVFSGCGTYVLDLQGPGALHPRTQILEKAGYSPGRTVKLAPGQTYSIAVSHLSYGSATTGLIVGKLDRLYWTEPGEYTLTAVLHTRISPVPQAVQKVFDERSASGGPGKSNVDVVTLFSNPVTLKVVDAKPQVKADPLGVPLDLKLLAKKTSYMLDLGGKTAEEFQRLIKEGPRPSPPQVDLEATVHNIGKEAVIFLLGGTNPTIEAVCTLKGAGAVNVPLGPFFSARPSRPPERIVLAPGKSHTFAIKQLSSSPLGKQGQVSFWTQAGEYTVTAALTTQVSPAPKASAAGTIKDFGSITLTSNPVKLKVIAPN